MVARQCEHGCAWQLGLHAALRGELDEMRMVASAVPALGGAAAARADAALARRGHISKHDLGALRAEWAALMDVPAGAGRAT